MRAELGTAAGQPHLSGRARFQVLCEWALVAGHAAFHRTFRVGSRGRLRNTLPGTQAAL